MYRTYAATAYRRGRSAVDVRQEGRILEDPALLRCETPFVLDGYSRTAATVTEHDGSADEQQAERQTDKRQNVRTGLR
jgi:hypothetical protein